MKDKNGVTFRRQCYIFLISIIIMTVSMIIAATVEVYDECNHLATTEECYSPFECQDNNTCPCTEADFEELYATGMVKHKRPYRCDPTDMAVPPLAIGNLVAFSVGILAIFAIGILSIIQSRKCDCDSKCSSACGCTSEAGCDCPHDCPGCCRPSKYGLKTVCTCANCKMKMSTENSSFYCQCCPSGTCKCNLPGSKCLFKQQVWVVKSAKD